MDVGGFQAINNWEMYVNKGTSFLNRKVPKGCAKKRRVIACTSFVSFAQPLHFAV
jgi:hypothetical protein